MHLHTKIAKILILYVIAYKKWYFAFFYMQLDIVFQNRFNFFLCLQTLIPGSF